MKKKEDNEMNASKERVLFYFEIHVFWGVE